MAELAAQDSQVLPAQAAFHAQQAVEKALKAVLVRLEVEFPRTHHLDELIALLGDAGVAWPLQPEQVEALTPYAVQSRYPGADASVSAAHVREAIALARQVLAWAKATCGLPPASHP